MAKQGNKLDFEQENLWMDYFATQQQKAQNLQAEITRLDREIDQLVYQLYELTDEEIKIVEGV